MTIQADIQSLSPSALIELFTLDMSKWGQPISYFHAGTNGLTQNVVWQGNTYTPIPIEAEGFDTSSKGTLPRPKFRVANISGVFSAAIANYDDLVGATVTRKRTFAKYLDAVNFPGGVNVTADANQYLNDDIWYVEQKASETRYIIEWELSSAFDLQGVKLPLRQVIQNACPWAYRGAECGYVGTNYFDINDTACAVGADVCAKRLSSCTARFVNVTVPFGGFPGARRND